MTDDELQKMWPELGTVVTELRYIDQSAVADTLVHAALTGTTTREILENIGLILTKHRALRLQLSDAAIDAWDAVMAEVSHAFRGSKFAQWLEQITR